MPQWDYMFKGFIRGNACERESRKRNGEGSGSCQAADLSLGEGRRQRLAGVSATSVRHEKSREEACSSRGPVRLRIPQ